MPDLTARLDLPLIKPSQAQKHVTHNEALQLLDGLVQATLEEVGAQTPPFEPVTGQLFALGANPTGDWAGQGDMLALRIEEAWLFIAPQPGWRAWDKVAGRLLAYDAVQGWAEVVPELNNLDGVGINTGWDATNRLAVSSPASLFTHEGAGHQLKVNKASAGDTASLLFQSNWTGHAEMGLAGDTAFSIKVSDGTNWYDAIKADPVTQEVTISMPVTGSAVQSSVNDNTADRLMKTKAFGLGLGQGENPTLTADLDDFGIPAGPNIYAGGSTLNKPLGKNGAGVVWRGWGGLGSVGEQHQLFGARLPSGVTSPILYYRSMNTDGAWSDWASIFHTRSLVGAISQTGGALDLGSAALEQGSNANGKYWRFANGIQICKHSVAFPATTTASGAMFLSASDATWTYPAAFVDTPSVIASRTFALARGAFLSAPGSTPADQTTTFAGRICATTSDATARSYEITAIGRWF